MNTLTATFESTAFFGSFDLNAFAVVLFNLFTIASIATIIIMVVVLLLTCLLDGRVVGKLTSKRIFK